MRLLLTLALVGSALGLSAVRFTARSGVQTMISYDGSRLDVPGYCESHTCTANGAGVAKNSQGIADLTTALVAEDRKLNAAIDLEAISRQQEDTAIRAEIVSAIAAQRSAQTTADAELRSALLAEIEARKKESEKAD